MCFLIIVFQFASLFWFLILFTTKCNMHTNLKMSCLNCFYKMVLKIYPNRIAITGNPLLTRFGTLTFSWIDFLD